MPLEGVLLLVFLGVASVTFFLMYLLIPGKTVLEERLDDLSPKTEESALTAKPPTAMQKFLARLGAGIPIKPQYYGKYTKMLVAAGIRKEKFTLFMGFKVFLAVLFPLTYMIFYGIPIERNFTMRVLVVVISAILGFLLPSFWLSRKVKKRQIAIFHELPDVLDLMTVCVESGLSLDAAIIRVSEDRQFKKSPLGIELRLAMEETRAGKPRPEALRDMGERTMVDDIRSFAAMLIQTDRLGTSLVQSMRVHSDSLRTIRMQRAEERAAKTTVKLVFPLAFLIFPTLLVVILGPAIIRMIALFENF